MIDFANYFTACGEEYPYLCTLHTLEWMQEQYGSITAWQFEVLGLGEQEGQQKEPDIKGLVKSWTEMINQGILLENLRNHEKREKVTEEEVSLILSRTGMRQAVTMAFEELIRCINGGKQKNEEPTQTAEK